jgi:hypothetical protein
MWHEIVVERDEKIIQFNQNRLAEAVKIKRRIYRYLIDTINNFKNQNYGSRRKD